MTCFYPDLVFVYGAVLLLAIGFYAGIEVSERLTISRAKKAVRDAVMTYRTRGNSAAPGDDGGSRGTGREAPSSLNSRWL